MLQEQRIGLQGGVDLGEDRGQGGLFSRQLIAKIIDAAGKVPLLRTVLRNVGSQNPFGGVNQVVEVGAEIVGETRPGQILKEALNRGRIGGQQVAQGGLVCGCVLVHRQSSIVVQVDAQGGQVDEAAISGNRIGDISQQAGLQGAKRTVRTQWPLGIGRGINRKLGVDALDDGIVGGNEVVDGVRDLGGVGSNRDLHRSVGVGRNTRQVECDPRNGASHCVAGAAYGHAVNRQGRVASCGGVEVQACNRIGGDADAAGLACSY